MLQPRALARDVGGVALAHRVEALRGVAVELAVELGLEQRQNVLDERRPRAIHW